MANCCKLYKKEANIVDKIDVFCSICYTYWFCRYHMICCMGFESNAKIMYLNLWMLWTEGGLALDRNSRQKYIVPRCPNRPNCLKHS